MIARFYRIGTGVFTGQAFAGPLQLLEANTPAGCAAWTGEVPDWQSQRVDLQAGGLVDYQPPAPPGDAKSSWAWDAQARRWRSAPTLVALKAAKTATVQALIDRQEARQLRPMRELRIAELAGDAWPQSAADALLAIAEAIKALQALRASIAAARTAAELAAIVLPEP